MSYSTVSVEIPSYSTFRSRGDFMSVKHETFVPQCLRVAAQRHDSYPMGSVENRGNADTFDRSPAGRSLTLHGKYASHQAHISNLLALFLSLLPRTAKRRWARRDAVNRATCRKLGYCEGFMHSGGTAAQLDGTAKLCSYEM